MPKKPPATVSEMRLALLALIQQREKHRFDASQDYRVCELWNMDNPPDTFEYSRMADRLDDLVGFHITDAEIMDVYDLSLAPAAIYLFDLKQSNNTKVKPSSKASRKIGKQPRTP